MRKLKEMIKAIDVILNNVHEGIVIADTEGRVVYVNEANARITGQNNKEVIGRYVKDVVPESSLLEVLETGKEKLGTRTRVGDKYVISNIVPIYDEGQLIGSISVFMDITELEELNKKLKEAEEQISHLSAQLSGFLGNGEFVAGQNPAMQKVLYIARKAAGVNSNVLITGESGTGKELLARFIHQSGVRRDKPFVTVNCAAIPESLLESELFGYEAGAFTGADRHGKKGLFEQADKGTIFLDEIGDMPLVLQVKLLRVLQDQEIRRLGGTKRIKLDIRVIAATNKAIEKMVEEGTFREDLYFRLNVIRINIPPLRARPEDIPIYVKHLLHKLCRRIGKDIPEVTPSAMKSLIMYNFPGNIRELENILEKCLVMDEDGVIDQADLTESLNTPRQSSGFYINTSGKWPSLREVERELLKRTLALYSNRSQAAKMLGISRATLYRKLREMGLG